MSRAPGTTTASLFGRTSLYKDRDSVWFITVLGSGCKKSKKGSSLSMAHCVHRTYCHVIGEEKKSTDTKDIFLKDIRMPHIHRCICSPHVSTHVISLSLSCTLNLPKRKFISWSNTHRPIYFHVQSSSENNLNIFTIGMHVRWPHHIHASAQGLIEYKA